MSYNAPTPSSPVSLTSSIVNDTSRPSSTRPEAGWGSPSPVPDSFPPVSLATVLTPIHSVTIPLYAHTLRDDFPDSQDIKKLSDYLRSPAFALSIDSFLDIGSPLYALRRAYLKNSHLRLMSTNISPSLQQTVLSRLIREVYLEIEGSLVMAMYQLGMLEFLEDIDRYMLELSRRNSPDSSSSFVTALSTRTTPSSNVSASSSPLMSDEERILQRVESWWTRGNSQVPLPSTHPRYHQACHSCHRLGYYRNQCPIYQCPHCTRWATGHNPNRCPLCRRTPLLLRLTRIEANVDLKDEGEGFPEGRLRERRARGPLKGFFERRRCWGLPQQLLATIGCCKEFKDKGLQGAYTQE